MANIKFMSCKHLDYSDNYNAKKTLIFLGETKVCWVRTVIDESYPKLVQLVQFCKLRGRMNNPEMCTCAEKAQCKDYKDFQHEVDYD